MNLYTKSHKLQAHASGMILSHLCCGQSNALAFNKGLLLNAAVREMSHRVPIDCIIFHGVDLVPVGGDKAYS